MSQRNWTRSIGAAAVAVAIVAGWSSGPAIAAKLGADYFPNIVLTTQDGKDVHFYDDLLKGKIVALNFIYTQCEFSCSLETARLAQVQDLLHDRVGKDVFFYSISIDPDHDTPAVLKDYAAKFKAGPGWTFLTGKKEDIDLLATKLGMSEDASITSAPGHDIDGHTAHLLIGNEETGQWLRDSGTDNPRFLARLIGRFVDDHATETLPGRGGSDGSPLKIGSPGQYLFGKECAACHTIGHGDKIGPDLKEVANRRDRAWLARYISQPDKVLASGDPIARVLRAKYSMTMPNLRVGDRDLAALMSFLSAQAGEGGAEAALGDHGEAAADHHMHHMH